MEEGDRGRRQKESGGGGGQRERKKGKPKPTRFAYEAFSFFSPRFNVHSVWLCASVCVKQGAAFSTANKPLAGHSCSNYPGWSD